uniref:Uncharacterized protein n=1 Tax=Globisporangium ultimum (strain ATCC 200006 / CBS 805.95 / DAOM BR144) TaxID=431595 RepID=K3WRD2_GLOUD
MDTVPGPLCCTTLSSAYRAPPPMTLDTLEAEPPLMDSASSHTSVHHTFSMVQPCFSQCTPSIWFLPMMTFLSVAPGSTRNTIVFLLLSFWPWHLTFLSSYVFMPPSKVVPALTTCGATSWTSPLLAGQAPVGMAAASTWDESARAAVATRAATENDLTMVKLVGEWLIW